MCFAQKYYSGAENFFAFTMFIVFSMPIAEKFSITSKQYSIFFQTSPNSSGSHFISTKSACIPFGKLLPIPKFRLPTSAQPAVIRTGSGTLRRHFGQMSSSRSIKSRPRCGREFQLSHRCPRAHRMAFTPMPPACRLIVFPARLSIAMTSARMVKTSESSRNLSIAQWIFIIAI